MYLADFLYLCTMIAYKYKLYRTDKTKHLDKMLREASFVWNHALALQKRYYQIYHKYIGIGRMKSHFVKHIGRCLLHSQTVQEILERLDEAYMRFFKHLAVRPPKFKKAKQLEYSNVFDGILDFEYQHLLCKAIHTGKAIVRNQKLHEEVRLHLARYPTGFQLWLFLDNHDLNRFLFECGGDKTLLKEGIAFSKQWGMPYLMFYGTEKELINENSIFDGTPYADERVRMCLK